MKRTGFMFNTLAALVATTNGAFAAGTEKVYSSSILVLVFIGFLALVVVGQLIPAIMTLIGAIKGLAKRREDDGMSKVKVRN